VSTDAVLNHLAELAEEFLSKQDSAEEPSALPGELAAALDIASKSLPSLQRYREIRERMVPVWHGSITPPNFAYHLSTG